ncbi:MAG TPA: hypothetical protein VIG55_15105 [Methylosinus sp.]|jgi:hypothetical protein
MNSVPFAARLHVAPAPALSTRASGETTLYMIVCGKGMLAIGLPWICRIYA